MPGKDTFTKLYRAVKCIRRQLRTAQKRREEVCEFIRGTANPKVPRHSCMEPDMNLTEEEVTLFMRPAAQGSTWLARGRIPQ